MNLIKDEALGFNCLTLADGLVKLAASEHLQSPTEVEGVHDVREMSAQLGLILKVLSVEGRVLNRSVHAFGLLIGPSTLDPPASMLMPFSR